MIIKNYELEKNNFLDSRIFLFYGDNEGYKKEIISKIHHKTKFEKFLYYEKDILNNKESFYSSVLTKSFFESKKIIIVNNASDKMLSIIEEIINKDMDDTILILNADILEKKSKIRNFFEKSKKLVCVAFYPDEFRNLSFILQNFLKEKKLRISKESANLIIERSNGSRDHLKNELKKIETYALNKKEIHLSEIIKLTNLGKNYNISELVESCLAKNHKKISKIINENNFSNEDTIIIIRTFLLKAKRLLNLSRNLEVEKNLDDVVSKYKPPIFWKEKEVVKLQLNLWSMNDLKKLIYEINNTELQIKKNINISLNVLLDFIFKNSKLVSN